MTIVELLNRFLTAWPPVEGVVFGDDYHRVVEREFFAREKDRALQELFSTVAVMAANPAHDFSAEAQRMAGELDEHARRVVSAIMATR